MMLYDGKLARTVLGVFGFSLFLLLTFVLEKYVRYKSCSSGFALYSKKIYWFRGQQCGLTDTNIFAKTCASHVMKCIHHEKHSIWIMIIFLMGFMLNTSCFSSFFQTKQIEIGRRWRNGKGTFFPSMSQNKCLPFSKSITAGTYALSKKRRTNSIQHAQHSIWFISIIRIDRDNI
jgi:hypothetical protein